QQYSRYRAAAASTMAAAHVSPAVMMSCRGVGELVMLARYPTNPSVRPTTTAAASELAFASTSIRDTSSGLAGLVLERPEIRRRRSRPAPASTAATASRAGTPVHGSGGRD